MMQMRFQGSDHVAQHREAAAHPGRVFDADVLRAEEGAHQLLQHQADAPGGQQRLQRPAVQEADHAALQRRTHQRRRHEGHRHGGHQVPVETRPGRYFWNTALHHIGGVGADHHQLAVRHVDDAHQPVGDGQAQRHQQQDGAQADAAEDGAHACRPTPARPRCWPATRCSAALTSASVSVAQPLVEQQLGVGVLASRPELPWRLQALGLVAAAQQAGGAHQLELALINAVGLGRKGFFDERQARFVGGLCQQRLDMARCARTLSSLLNSLSAASALSSSPRIEVVVDHVFGVVGHRHFGAGDRVEALVVLDDKHLVTLSVNLTASSPAPE